MSRRQLVALGLLIAVLAAAFLWHRRSGGHVPEGQPPLATVDREGIEALREDFNAAPAAFRVILLLSPT